MLAKNKTLEVRDEKYYLIARDLRFSYSGIVQSLAVLGVCMTQTYSFRIRHSGEPLRIVCEADFVVFPALLGLLNFSFFRADE